MIKIYDAGKHRELISKTILTALKKLDTNFEDIDVEISLVSEESIRELNREERQIDSVTDVLSFQSIPDIQVPVIKEDYPMDINGEDDSVIIGEIFICEKRAEEQANEYGHSLEREIAFLTCHGLLHLLNFDHEDKEGEEEMNNLTEKILESMGLGVDEALDTKAEEFKSGFVAITGKPNAGKSTLVNTIVGEKVAIVSWKPQTTRDKIMGVYNEKNYQIIFLDTPGIHTPKNNLGVYMMKNVSSALDGVDCVVYVVDCEKGYDDKDKINIVSYLNAGHNVIVAVNKVDHVTKEKVFEILSELNKLQNVKAIVPVSALRGRNIEPLKAEIKKLLKDNIKYFAEDQYTDKNMRFMTAEIIREKALRLLDKEVPYGIGIDVREYSYVEGKNMIEINADIICEKAAHKPIILGKGGSMIKKISTYARQDIEAMTGSKVFIKLFVRVKDDWRTSDSIMKDLGYDNKGVK
ncbi:GTPase Era [bacterium]|nr:GTPase Era [bacterium]